MDVAYDYLISVCCYRKVVVSIVHELKYYGLSSISRFIAKLMYDRIFESNLNLDFDIITTVPLHFVKEKERGYNQASLIAKDLASLFTCEFNGDILKRTSYTTSQATLEHDERLKNLKNAFKLKKNIDLNNKTIVLLDDVFTTGTTVNECCRELRKANPKKIIILTLGRA